MIPSIIEEKEVTDIRLLRQGIIWNLTEAESADENDRIRKAGGMYTQYDGLVATRGQRLRAEAHGKVLELARCLVSNAFARLGMTNAKIVVLVTPRDSEPTAAFGITIVSTEGEKHYHEEAYPVRSLARMVSDMAERAADHIAGQLLSRVYTLAQDAMKQPH